MSHSKYPIAPKSFKYTLDMLQPMFCDNNQHDSQEFLIYMLDMIHEDLNRVQKKEVVKPINDNIQVPDDKLAKLSWQKHLQRNQSIIVDILQGQFRSKLVCD